MRAMRRRHQRHVGQRDQHGLRIADGSQAERE
jgi:hypothetical protein